MISRRTIYLVTTESPAYVLAHLVRVPADLTGRTFVDVCETHVEDN